MYVCDHEIYQKMSIQQVVLLIALILIVTMQSKASSSVNRLTGKGLQFYNSIGNPRFISAPMVDQSSLSWRLLTRRHGADLAFSQMMHARNFVIDKKYRSDCIDWDDYTHAGGNKNLEEEARRLDKPLIVQLAGDVPETLVNAGKFLEKDVAAIDLNLGCPQKIAKRGNYGAYLLTDPDRIVQCLEAMVKSLDCPITCKIRKLDDDNETLELVHRIEKTGVSMITIHGRTVRSSKLYTGPVDWDIIKKCKEQLSIPVIANGGIQTYDDCIKCLEYTGADGVMSSEGLLENPKMFSPEGDRMFREEYVKAQLNTVDEYLMIVQSYPLPRPLFQIVRSHLFKMLHRFTDADRNSDVRKLLSEGDFTEMKQAVMILKERLSTVDYMTDIALAAGLIGSTSWYYRHRDERASNRVYSPRKSRIMISDKKVAATDSDIQDKMAALKLRLLEKKDSYSF